MLFTVTGTFSDFTAAYEQYDCPTPAEALATFIMSAEALSAYDPQPRATAAKAEGHRITHMAGGKQGLWAWHLTVRLEHAEVALYGGCIVQTDPAGPVRPSSAA
ncbi:hypothetical protein [Comamonas aquatica]|uniref:hypothetical protein n=1 Tax=Comamonas aquatica TaxID=225991 RepID=UPI002449F9ED|nr:hypothetical protein [Comamonas aquatica]MDH1813516.1 hypothetical protein [Comamonas aquatica]